MKSKYRYLWYWLGAGIVLFVVLAVAHFLFRNFYHRPVLVDMVDNVDVVGYLEWEGDKSGDIYNRFISFDEGLAIPTISAWESRLHCSLASCAFWGKNNAVVLRKGDSGIFPEFYFYQANKTELLNTWQELTKGAETLNMFDQTYHLVVLDDLIVITFRSMSNAPVVLGSQSVSKMPWIVNKPIPAWGRYIGFGFCQTECIDHLSKQLGGKLHDNFPLFSIFLHDTISYLEFLVIPENSQLKFDYQLHFSPTYVSPVISDATRDVSSRIFATDTYVLSGDKLQSKLDVLGSEGQNTGLWKTVMSLGRNELMGESWLRILQQVNDDPYELHIRTPANKSVLILDEVADFTRFKTGLTSTLTDTMPILFPQKQILDLPDGTAGMELVKNKNITVNWLSDNNDEDFVIEVSDNAKALFSVYGQKQNQKVTLSLSPLTNESEKYCLSSGNTEELQSIQFPNPSLPLIWWNVRSVSSQEVAGEVVFDRSPPSTQCPGGI